MRTVYHSRVKSMLESRTAVWALGRCLAVSLIERWQIGSYSYTEKLFVCARVVVGVGGSFFELGNKRVALGYFNVRHTIETWSLFNKARERERVIQLHNRWFECARVVVGNLGWVVPTSSWVIGGLQLARGYFNVWHTIESLLLFNEAGRDREWSSNYTTIVTCST